MRLMRLIFSLLALLLLAAGDTHAGWGPAGCPPVGRLVIAQPPATYRWVHREDTPDQTFLYLGAKQIGTYSYATGFYLPIIGNQWGKAAKSPIAPPLNGPAAAVAPPLFGVDRSQLTGHEDFSASGKKCTEAEAHQMIGAALRDDSKAGQVSIFERDAGKRKTLREAIERAPELQGSSNGAKVQVYDPEARPNKEILAPFRLDTDERFRTTGFKMVAQAAPVGPDGTSKAESWYELDGVKTVIEAVRKVDPNYNPNVNPIPTLPSLPHVNWEILLLCGLGIVVVVAVARSS